MTRVARLARLAEADGPAELANPGEQAYRSSASEVPVVASLPSRYVDRAAIDAAVHRINTLAEDARLDTALRIGAIVVEELFGGDVALLRSRGPRFVGFRRLVEHPGLRVPARQLWRAARVYAQSRALPAEVTDRLSLRQREALLPVADLERQIALAEQAAREGWTSRRLERAVAAEQKPRGGGRRPRPALVRVLAGIERLLAEDLPACLLVGRDGMEARRLWERVAQGLARVAEAVGVAAPLLVGCTEGAKGDDRAETTDSAENVDADADGYVARDDCDDENPDVHPGVPDPCNGLDDDCSGVVDDGVPGETTLCAENEALWFVQEQHYSHEDGCAASISGDIDGDGRADLLLGGSGWDSMGQVHVFRAVDLYPGVNPTELDHWLLRGDAGDYAASCAWESGRAASFIPDVDEDGRSEIVVGAPAANEGRGGAYLVTASALDEAVGELHLADFADVLLSDSQDTAWYAGISVSSVGDLDGDGTPELFVGADWSAWIVPGARVLADTVWDLAQGVALLPPELHDEFVFGNVGQQAGDVDGDGLDDLLVPCPGCGERGVAYLYLGSSIPSVGQVGVDSADLQVDGRGRLNRFGLDATGGADVDGDGLDDWAVGSTDQGTDGGVFLFFNSSELLGTTAEQSAASVHITDNDSKSGFLGRFVTIGDFDGDGGADLAVEDNDPGVRYFVFWGGGLGSGGTLSSASADRVYTPLDAGLTSGRLDVGDADGDGTSELLAGSPGWGPYAYPDRYGAALIVHTESDYSTKR